MTPVIAIRVAMMAGVLLFGAATWFTQRSPDWTPSSINSLVPVARIFWFVVTAGLIILFPRYRAMEAPARANTLAIVAWALGETLALFGGVLYFMSGTPGWYVAGVVALAACFVAFPGKAVS